MKQRLILLLKTFGLLILFFVLMKPAFMLYHRGLYAGVGLTDYFRVVWHGLPMDASVAGYFTVLPALLLTLSVWERARLWADRVRRGWTVVMAVLLSMIYIVDLVLYGFWKFRLDTTPIFYFTSSPKDAFASVSVGYAVVALLTCCAFGVGLWWLLHRYLDERLRPVSSEKRKRAFAILLLCTAALFLPIRGSVTTSTMNLGRVYFSQNQQLNHAAINPVFSLLSSVVGEMKIAGMYRFMEPAEADRLFADLQDMPTVGREAHVERLLTTERPNVIVVVLESFSGKIMSRLGGLPNVAVNMDRLADEGVLFTNFYANSFRTDRGLAAILGAYPAQPTTSIMKYPKKVDSLPMWTHQLRNEGYDLAYFYGGDADFTGMRSFLVTGGFDRITSDQDFPLKYKLSKWGVPDQYVFDATLRALQTQRKTPFLYVVQTSSSHEPYDVPYHKLKDERLNAFAYTDDCLGRFIAQLKRLPAWKNTLVVLVPDHLGAYPKDIDYFDFSRYHIPMIWVGGAVKSPARCEAYGSQIDIAATLLSQMRLSYRSYRFSKDMLNDQVRHFGYFSFPNAFGFVDAEDSVMYNCDNNQVVADQGRRRGYNLPYGKAFLQKLYDDLGKR